MFHFKVCFVVFLFAIILYATDASQSNLIRVISKASKEDRKNNRVNSPPPPVQVEKKPSANEVATHSHHSEHKLSVFSLVVDIVADLCPHGMLPLAFAIAQGGPTGILPAFILFAVFGSMSAYTMTSYAEMADKTNSKNIGELWANLKGKRTQIIADLTIFLLCFGSCIFYSAFIGDIFSALASAVGITGILSYRWVILTIMSGLVLLPLCLLDDMSSLQFSSNLGAFGVLFTVFAHIKRQLDGSYAVGGKFYSLLNEKQLPKFPDPKYSLFNLNAGILTLVNILGVAFLAHYNAINYYRELENRDISKFRKTVGIGYGVAVLVFVAMMIVGYDMFGSTSQPLLLNNFHRTDDTFATAARIATGVAITFAYPLMFAGLKGALKSMLSMSDKTSSKDSQGNVQINPVMYKGIQTAILAVITSIAFKCSEGDVSLVLGIVGSVLGCGSAYVIPGYLRLIYLKELKSKGGNINKLDSILNHMILSFGIIFGVLGVWVTLKDAGSHHH